MISKLFRISRCNNTLLHVLMGLGLLRVLLAILLYGGGL